MTRKPRDKPRDRPARPLARALGVLALLILGVVAATRVQVSYLPERSFPELWVSLTFREAHDLGELTRHWLQPLESSIRAAGGISSTAGEVGPRGAQLRVRLAPGIDPLRKAARLESELAGLARRLGGDGSIRIDPVTQGGGQQSAVLFLSDVPSDDANAGGGRISGQVRALVESLRDAPEVRRVEVAGQTTRELRWTTGRAADLLPLRLALADSERTLGRVPSGGRLLPVLMDDANAVTAAERWVSGKGGSVVRLGALATPQREIRDSEFLARLDGRPGLVLLVSRDPAVSPLVLERALRRTLDRFGYEVTEGPRAVAKSPETKSPATRPGPEARFLWSEADPIQNLLRRLALGALLATVLGALAAALLLGWRSALWQAAAIPLALATAANVFRLLDLPLDVTTAQAAVLAIGAALIFQLTRVTAGSPWTGSIWTVLCAFTLPVAVHLLGRDLAMLLAQPVKAFAAVVPALVPALLLLPTPERPIHEGARRVVRFVLRRPWGVTLLALAVAYGAFGVFGDRLLPRSGSLRPATADVTVRMNLGEGGTLEQGARWIAAVEGHLLTQAAVTSVWGYHNHERAFLRVTVAERYRAPLTLHRLAIRWHSQLTALGSAVEVDALGSPGGGEPMRFDSSLRTRPEADEDVQFYRFILRSSDLARLRRAHTRMLDALRQTSWGRDPRRVTTGWTQPEPHLELAPMPGRTAAEIERAAQLVAERVALPTGGRVAVHGASDQPVLQSVVTAQTASRPSATAQREPPQLADVLAPGLAVDGGSQAEDLLAPKEVFRLREALGSPSLRREDGAFVLPMTVRFIGLAKGQALEVRGSAHRTIASLDSQGVDIEQPSLTPNHWTEERVRLLSMAAALPLLLFLLAAVRLNSLPLALAAMVPLAVAVGVTTAALAALGLHVEEPTLLALAAALAATMPLVLEVAQAVRVRQLGRLASAAGYRWLARRLPHAAVAVTGWLALLVGAGWGLAAERHPWAPPLRLAGITGTVVVLSALLVLPGLLRAVDRLRFYDRAKADREAHPPPWKTEGKPALEVRRLTKVYGNGFQALCGVTFRLEPGIVGLLGPNGAGKTTLLRSLCGLLEPSRGRVLYRGVAVKPENLAEYRKLVGFLPQDFDAYEGFTAEEFLDYWALQRGIQDPKARRREIEDLLKMIGLDDAANRKVRDFSGGMRRRIGIARSLLGAPPILIVDEPTTGLDVDSRNRLRESLLAAAGDRIILFSTHIASDVAAAASRILLLNQGRLLFDGPSGELIEEAQGRVFEALVDDHHLRDFAATYRVTTRLRTLEGVKVRAVAAKDQEPAGVVVRPNLEEAYLAKLGTTAQKRSRVRSLLEL